VSDLALDLEVAVTAVRDAARACHAVQQRLVEAHALQKGDKSPVTVADFAAQAIVCAHLEAARPADPIAGEEDSAALREAGQRELLTRVVEHVGGAPVGAGADEARVLAWIDRGGSEARGPRFWTLDPIDGTKGFLRGQQYAVALALIERGEVVLGVLGCPNLACGDGHGALFTAVRGERTRELPLWDVAAPGREVAVAPITTAADARFCESVESDHSDQEVSAEIARRLGIRLEPYRIDSQCKYAAVARNDASIYLRMPTREDYREKIWDHAAGKLVVECAGGTVTDIAGRPLDFAHGRCLELNRGIVATGGRIHAEVLEAIRSVRTGAD
jgi:3'(2'), 5'-bisphosphate nucleotidase